MEVFDIEQKDIHGGSFRVFVARRDQRPVSETVGDHIRLEIELGIYTQKGLAEFAAVVKQNKKALVWLLNSLKRQNKRIVGVSAPAKGMTLLNYCRIDNDLLDFVTEKSKLKVGRFTPGAHIPVVPDSELLTQQPDYALLLAWNFSEEIMRNLDEFRKRGGKFIIPIPSPRIVG
jgi:hypothetical protein